jgi:hypothetical protein
LKNLPPPIRILAFLVVLVVLWLPVALPFFWLAEQGIWDLGGAIATALLYLGFILLWPVWARRVYRLGRPWQGLGVVWRSGVLADWGLACGLGLGGIAALAIIELLCGWARLNPLAADLPWVVLEGGLVAVAVGLAEELLFRGWLLFELEQGFSPAGALWGNAIVFASAHFIKPLAAILATLPQFFGLFLLGLTLVWARRSPSRVGPGYTALGFPAGLHGGLVWGYYILSVGKLLEVSGTVPDWVTGIQGNPLAGLLGLGLLGILATLFYRRAHPQK